MLGRLLEDHYALVDDPRYLVGNFNAHMASLILLQADEGFWAGDHSAAGRLKGLVTSDKQMIELKGKDPVFVNNYVHLLVTSNNDWVVPAGHDERRFAVLDVGDGCQQNHEYFAEMMAELGDGGYGALLHYLMEFDLSQVDLWDIPRTQALWEQKLASLSVEESWWFNCLQQGWVHPDDKGEWPLYRQARFVHGTYLKFCEGIGARHRLAPDRLGVVLKKLAPGIVKGRRRFNGNKRLSVYEFPSLVDLRAHFETMVRAEIDWGETDLGTEERGDIEDDVPI